MDSTDNLIDQSLIDSISPIAPVLIVKILVIIGLVVYVIFAFILIRQVKIKRETVDTPLGKKLSLIAIIHFVASVLLLLAAIFIL